MNYLNTEEEFDIITINEVSYYIRPEKIRIVDHYGPGGSVELDHYEYLDYNVIDNYLGETSELDFRFAGKNDEIDIEIQDTVYKIKLNCQNIKEAYFTGNNKISYDITIDCNIIDTILNIKNFLKNNKDNIKMINFQNVSNPIIKKLIILTCMKENITIISFKNEWDNNYNHNKSLVKNKQLKK